MAPLLKASTPLDHHPTLLPERLLWSSHSGKEQVSKKGEKLMTSSKIHFSSFQSLYVRTTIFFGQPLFAFAAGCRSGFDDIIQQQHCRISYILVQSTLFASARYVFDAICTLELLSLALKPASKEPTEYIQGEYIRNILLFEIVE